ncbi:MAG: hypothetical protein AAF467_00225 [Actinomycetota bacterium]
MSTRLPARSTPRGRRHCCGGAVHLVQVTGAQCGSEVPDRVRRLAWRDGIGTLAAVGLRRARRLVAGGQGHQVEPGKLPIARTHRR